MKLKLKQRQVQKSRLSMVMITSGSMLLMGAVIKILFFSSYFIAETALGGPVSSPTFSFKSPSLISGTAGTVGAVYLFSNVISGVDARVTLQNKFNGASITNIDQLGSATGYDDAFQPIVTAAAGTAGTPDTSYIEWLITFKKAGTATDTTFQSISATALDIDGGPTIRETVEALSATSYSTDLVAGTELSISQNTAGVKAISSANNYSGIDTLNKTVIFQINFSNVSSITYRTGGINTSTASARNTSIYFKAFFTNSSPLPIELTSFTAKNINKSVVLNWTTASEKNNDYFIVERSKDGNLFSEIMRIRGAGNSSVLNKYSCSDEQPFIGISYYRLKQFDFNGMSETFDPVSVNLKPGEKSTNNIIVSPNPFVNDFKFQFEASEKDLVDIQILNLNGTEVYNDQMYAEEGNNIYHFSNSPNLKPGTYFLRILNNKSVLAFTKIIKK